MTNMLPQDKKKEALGASDTQKMAAYYEMQKLEKLLQDTRLQIMMRQGSMPCRRNMGNLLYFLRRV
jgi:hypothetical protein